MPVVEAVIVVPVSPDVAFAVSQTTGPVRYRWDPFVREQHFTDGATRPGKGVRTCQDPDVLAAARQALSHDAGQDAG